MQHSVSPIGYVRSCFKEKFAIPRQPSLAPAARGVLELLPPFDKGDAVAGLEQVSHVWLLFLGQSVVRLDRVEADRLFISGIDLLDGTPVLDIKPYVPYADALPDARNDMAADAPTLIEVQWTESGLLQAHREALRLGEPLLELIEQCLAQDPRPAYQKPEPERRYGAQFWDVDVRWHYPAPDTIRVLEVIPATPRPT
jgi:tRNA (Thr-GGU) A37 N-methylase